MKSYKNIAQANKLDPAEFKGEVAFEVLHLTEKGTEDRPVIEWLASVLWTSVPEQEILYGKEFNVAFFFGQNCDVTIGQLKRILKGGGFQVQNWEDNADVMIPGALNYLATRHAILMGKTSTSGGKSFFNPTKLLRVDPRNGEAFPDYAIPEEVPDADVLASFNIDTTKVAAPGTVGGKSPF